MKTKTKTKAQASADKNKKSASITTKHASALGKLGGRPRAAQAY